MTMPEQKKAVVPRLRFPEFRDAGPWEVKRLGDVYQFIPTNSFSREQLTYESGTIKNIHYGDIHTKYRALFDVEREHVPFLIGNGVTEDFDDKRFCVPGDVILADASEDLDDIGKAIEIVNIGSHKVVAGLHTLHARQLAEDLVIGFGGCLFQCNAIREQIRKQAQGAKVLGISATRLKSIKLAAPRKPEQQKIADCLSSLDELIELQAKQLEALQAHKKGLMQQLFPREGETTPRLRFPEFRNAGPWEVRRLGELLDYERPDKYIVESDNYEPQGIPVLTANKSFVLGYTSEQNGIYEDLPAIIFDDFTTDKKFVDFPFKVKSSAIKILKPKGENVIRFVFELMNLIQFDPGQHKRYYISEYQHISVLVPNTAEQQKIADCLSSLDELIELQAKQLEALQTHKKGLMQQLFPQEIDL